jgi:hypothetical protein
MQFDDVRFEGPAGAIGITDKTLAQYKEQAAHSRDRRIRDAFALVAADSKAQPADGNDSSHIMQAFAKMMLNEDLETANRMLVDELKLSADNNTWSLLHTPLYCRFYYLFSNRVGTYPGRMTPATEALLLSTLWERTAVKNDIFWARESVWLMDAIITAMPGIMVRTSIQRIATAEAGPIWRTAAPIRRKNTTTLGCPS